MLYSGPPRDPPACDEKNSLCTSAPPLYPRFLDPSNPYQVGSRDPHAEAPRVRGVGGLTGLRALPPTPKTEKFPCQEIGNGTSKKTSDDVGLQLLMGFLNFGTQGRTCLWNPAKIYSCHAIFVEC